MRIPLTDMKPGQSGTLVEVLGGHGMERRLSALGLRLSKQVRKISSMLMRGPVTIQVDRAQVAIGFGMARRIIVELD